MWLAAALASQKGAATISSELHFYEATILIARGSGELITIVRIKVLVGVWE